ncbi:meso-butanediol dehydrogenase/(S,S)-butanediol dehydrogenase/diacetyl reductase [Homoserinimonas aerilata]|uniref:Meso-butanediol dehydrogenase/(S,S)-butanediol dehydrogenase/diacetyl reductase n=1 Tax=Homoserinimonas aerilata TaxID=1162970 RepID=A0A542YFB7_9MICO|nr:SDR family oxidoreductase [Homoserinimonas aerilata]TQL46760.1 meso-butanediol dehydrogenase/(S,S)-butanediol dehydrogenase/diacetyl reductase [Homoserinimonas aerilata]
MTSLNELTVAITGSGQGIGHAMAMRFAQQGANIVISDIDDDRATASAEAVRELGGKAISVRADVTDADDCTALVAATVAEFGRLDVMICNAGIIQVKPLLDVTADDWNRTMNVNVTGTLLTLQAAARQMLSQEPLSAGRPKGKIITMASIAGRYAAGPMAPIIPHYRASKAAVINLTHSASYTLAPDVTVNAICPGLVDNDMWKLIDREWSEVEGWETGTAWKTRTSAVPLGRPQTMDDVAGLAEFLASPASDYMTGQAINIDGGLTVG